MTDVENADRVTDRRVLGQHPGAGVLQWHRPSAEGCEPCAGHDMPFVQRRCQQRVSLGILRHASPHFIRQLRANLFKPSLDHA
jgi:hypothetical protein